MKTNCEFFPLLYNCQYITPKTKISLFGFFFIPWVIVKNISDHQTGFKKSGPPRPTGTLMGREEGGGGLTALFFAEGQSTSSHWTFNRGKWRGRYLQLYSLQRGSPPRHTGPPCNSPRPSPRPPCGRSPSCQPRRQTPGSPAATRQSISNFYQ